MYVSASPSLDKRGEREGPLLEVGGLSVPTFTVNEDELGQEFIGEYTIMAGASESDLVSIVEQ